MASTIAPSYRSHTHTHAYLNLIKDELSFELVNTARQAFGLLLSQLFEEAPAYSTESSSS